MSQMISRTVDATPEQVWELWTTARGIEQWWAPEGFATEVQRLDLVPGGELVYTMTATAPDQIAFMDQNGMPQATVSRKTFTEVQAPDRLAYTSLIDFVPDHEPYEQVTVVQLRKDADGTRVEMTVEALHDEVWTERLVAGRTNELDNLARLVQTTSADPD